MAQKILTTFIDDTDGSEAEGTVRFGLDGAEYEIDLSSANADALRAIIEPYRSAARRSAGRERTVAGRRRPDRSVISTSAVRSYLGNHPELLGGRKLNDRGRIPGEFILLVPEAIRYGQAPPEMTLPAVPPVPPTPATTAPVSLTGEPPADVPADDAKTDDPKTEAKAPARRRTTKTGTGGTTARGSMTRPRGGKGTAKSAAAG